MHIRIVTFGLNIPAEDYSAHAVHIAPGFTEWPGLLAKWWLADPASATFGGVYVFATPADADYSRHTDLFRNAHQPGAEGSHDPRIRRPRCTHRHNRCDPAAGSGPLRPLPEPRDRSCQRSPPTTGVRGGRGRSAIDPAPPVGRDVANGQADRAVAAWASRSGPVALSSLTSRRKLGCSRPDTRKVHR